MASHPVTADASFAHLISELGLSLGIAALAPVDGLCELVIDGRHAVQIVHVGARDQALLSCRLGDHDVDAAQAALMARANFLQAGRGAVLCQAPDGKPCLQMALALSGCDAALLCAALESLLDEAERWAERLARESAPTAFGSANDPSLLLQAV